MNFIKQFARILNSNQSRSVVLCGNISDLYWDDEEYVPIIPCLVKKTETDGLLQIVYELNSPLRVSKKDKQVLCRAWVELKTGFDPTQQAVIQSTTRQAEDIQKIKKYQSEFLKIYEETAGNPAAAFELLRQLTICSRRNIIKQNLLIIVEAADMLVPAGDGDVSKLRDSQLRRIAIMQDWFSDPEFINGGDSVCLISESLSSIHPRISRLPQIISVEIPSPDTDVRQHFIEYFDKTTDAGLKDRDSRKLAAATAGLSLYALQQLLRQEVYSGAQLKSDAIIAKVESFIKSQVGEETVEYKKPHHKLSSCKGISKLREFLHKELIPRFLAEDESSLTGCAVAGPIGSGKTYIFEAVAAELGVPVLVLKNIRSQWFGQTDVIFERLRRTLEALDKVVLFIDEADTQFGKVSGEGHETERRLTGKIQAMMSDPRLKGKVIWLLMTARIHLLSADIRRPGRVGDLIVPVLDPEGDDFDEFFSWALNLDQYKPKEPDELFDRTAQEVKDSLQGYSAAAFSSLRSHLKAHSPTTINEVKELVGDLIPPAIGKTREYQKLQALLNCTRRSLLPEDTPANIEVARNAWEAEIKKLELEGID